MNAGTEGTIDTKRLIFPALGGFYQSIAPYSYAIIRFCAGAIVIYHGYMKLFAGFAGPVAQNVLTPLGFPRPLAWAYFLGVLEFFGGAALAVGFLTRPLALMFTVQMAIVTYWHAGNGYFFSSPRGGWEFPLLLTILYAAIFFRGAGRCAVDRMIGKEF
ncbi:MAG TPA: DoxX family protein [Xanthobacteraceae bacterium]|jgi:putative oxidoreductase|nr:DoxX family protein [Xanthobacteraceae bacterium]